MISLQKTGNAIKFTFDDNGRYLYNGTIEVPVNSLTLVTDGSDMFTFKKSATNDIFVSGLYSEIGMTKAELISFYKNNMVDSFINADEAQSMIDESISGKADTSAVTQSINEAVSGKADASAVTASIEAAVSGKASQSDLETVSGQVDNKQDTLVSGTNIKTINNESLLGSGNITIQGGGGGGEGTVSGYTFRNENFSYEYSDAFEGPVYIKYNGYSGDSASNRYAGSIKLSDSEWSGRDYSLNFGISNGVITASTTSYPFITISIENGIAAITSTSGYYITGFEGRNNFVGYVEKVYSSGNTSDVVENTVYDMLDNLSDGINAVDIKRAFFGLTNGTLHLTLEKGSTSFGTSVTLGSPTINTDGNRLNTQFATPEAEQKALNAGQWNMCDISGDYTYNGSYDDMTITFNSGYTGGSTSEIMYIRFYSSGGSVTQQISITYNITANTISYDASLSNYCTITDTLSTDYKFKITSNSGYRIYDLTDKGCSIAGVDAEDKSGYVIVLITTTSYIQDGQAVIDDIYSKLAALEARLNNS